MKHREIKETEIYTYLIEKGFTLEQFDSHETDLYIMFENSDQRDIIIDFLKEKEKGFIISYSNVEGQIWYGKHFMDIPFYLF